MHKSIFSKYLPSMNLICMIYYQVQFPVRAETVSTSQLPFFTPLQNKKKSTFFQLERRKCHAYLWGFDGLTTNSDRLTAPSSVAAKPAHLPGSPLPCHLRHSLAPLPTIQIAQHQALLCIRTKKARAGQLASCSNNGVRGSCGRCGEGPKPAAQPRRQAWRKKPPAATAAGGGGEGGDAVRRSRDPQEGPPAPQGISVVGEEVNGTCALDA